jgi:hypothetical protein
MKILSIGRADAHPQRAVVLAMVTMLLASLAALGAASPALATPEGEFAIFEQCPLSNPSVTACLIASTTSGEFTVGNRTVPIKNKITLQGGLIESETGTTFVAAANGQTLSKTPQTVPGGLIGIEGLFGEVTATTELAGPASSIGVSDLNLLKEEGTALSLPVKVKLSNPILGNSCYVGSNSHPIVLNLTTGTTSPPKPNKPIKGARGEFALTGEDDILNFLKNSLVNNSFAAPGVEGCGLLPFLVDPIVDLDLGVPASGGHNTAILEGTVQISNSGAVQEH